LFRGRRGAVFIKKTNYAGNRLIFSLSFLLLVYFETHFSHPSIAFLIFALVAIPNIFEDMYSILSMADVTCREDEDCVPPTE
jgi:hypothetical protein